MYAVQWVHFMCTGGVPGARIPTEHNSSAKHPASPMGSSQGLRYDKLVPPVQVLNTKADMKYLYIPANYPHWSNLMDFKTKSNEFHSAAELKVYNLFSFHAYFSSRALCVTDNTVCKYINAIIRSSHLLLLLFYIYKTSITLPEAIWFLNERGSIFISIMEIVIICNKIVIFLKVGERSFRY